MLDVGLVLEGGAMRGLYTAGVMDVLLDNNIEFKTIIGVSAGAAFGCNYVSKQRGRVLRYNLKYINDPRYMSFRNLIKTGDLFNAEFAYYTVPNELDIFDAKAFRESITEFYVVTTNILNGMPTYTELKDSKFEDVEWIRASASMPVVSKPVEINDNLYLDGGMTDPIPLKWMRENKTLKNIVILTRPNGYVKPAANQKLTKLFMSKYPQVKEVMDNRHHVYNKSLKYVETADNTLVIRPSIDLKLSRTEKRPHKLQEMYDLGVSDTLNMLNEITSFLDN